MKNLLKKHYFRSALLFAAGIFAAVKGGAQDVHFSQFFEAPLLRNPSLAGIFTGDVRAQAVYRSQWNSVTQAYRTVSLNGEYKSHVGRSADFVTMGLQLVHDRAGSVSWLSTHVLPAVNYHKSLGAESNRYLSLGFMGGFVERRIDVSKMTTESQFYGRGLGENILTPQYSYFDGSVGMSYNAQFNENPDNNMFAGLAYHHFTKPKNSFYRNQFVELDPKWVASVGIKFAVQETGYVTLHGDYSAQGRFGEAVIGALYGLKLQGEISTGPEYLLHGGAFFRWNDAFIPVIKMDYHTFSLSFSYDVNISRFRTSSYGRGGFELGLSYRGFTKSPNSSLNHVNCPRF